MGVGRAQTYRIDSDDSDDFAITARIFAEGPASKGISAFNKKTANKIVLDKRHYPSWFEGTRTQGGADGGRHDRVVEFVARSFMQDPFHFEEIDVGIDLGETRMINFKSANFTADLPKSRAAVPYMESVDIAKKKSCVGGVTRLNRVASGK